MSEMGDRDHTEASSAGGDTDAAVESASETGGGPGDHPAAEAGESGPAEAGSGGRPEATDDRPPAGVDSSDTRTESPAEVGDVSRAEAAEGKPVAGEPGEAGPVETAELAGQAAPELNQPEPSSAAGIDSEPGENGPVQAGPVETAEASAGHPSELQPVAEASEETSDTRAGTGDLPDDDTPTAAGIPAEASQDMQEDMAGRPDVSKQYPDVFKEQDASALAVDRPHQSPEAWIGDVNPGNGRNNCAECARAVQATWSGDPSAAATLNDRFAFGEPDACMPEWAGQESKPVDMQQVGDQLKELGPGSSAVVGFDRSQGAGHWFNAINDGGVIKAVDGQSGRIGPWPPAMEDLRFDQSEMRAADAIFFDSSGVIIK